jgi:hypothetical protein
VSRGDADRIADILDAARELAAAVEVVWKIATTAVPDLVRDLDAG